MRIWIIALTSVMLSVQAFPQEPPNQGFATPEAAKYADAAKVLIAEGLKRLEPMLDSLIGPRGTMYVGYPNLGDVSNPRFADPPRAFLKSVSTSQVLFEPFSRKPANKWDNYLVIDIDPKCTDDSVRLSISEDCHSISLRSEPGSTQAGAWAVLVCTHGTWKIVKWERMLMM